MESPANWQNQFAAPMETNYTVGGNGSFQCPSGYRFLPRDYELILEYLLRKDQGQPLPIQDRIIDAEVYKFDPEVLSGVYKKPNENECYFFTPRKRKYRNGTRPDRAAGNGFWKATGADKPILYMGQVIGYKKTLVFYREKYPRNDGKTNWIMHEYRLNQAPLIKTNADDMKLDNYVLCRIYNKSRKPSRNMLRRETADDDVRRIHHCASKVPDDDCRVSGPSTPTTDNDLDQFLNNSVDFESRDQLPHQYFGDCGASLWQQPIDTNLFSLQSAPTLDDIFPPSSNHTGSHGPF